jgi:hypothetical protein
LADIKTLNSRFGKRDAIREHEEKMKEYASFMAEIQEYLREPVTSNEERNFKDDVQVSRTKDFKHIPMNFL